MSKSRRLQDLSVVLIFLTVSIASLNTQTHVTGNEQQAPCQEGVVIQDRACSREYRTCQQGKWNAAICTVGQFDPDTKSCELSDSKCPGLKPLAGDRRSLRRRRQTSLQQQRGCTLSYSCPSDLRYAFVYPYWESCTSYVLCERGALSILSCQFQNYNYYNPRTLSCEEYPSPTNTCVNRMDTDLSPVQ